MSDDLSGGEAPYQKHSETSREAAEGVTAKLPRKRAVVLRIIAHVGGTDGLTDNQLIGLTVDTFRWNPNTARPRRIELERMGYVRESGTHRDYRTGRRSTLWAVTDIGRAWVERNKAVAKEG